MAFKRVFVRGSNLFSLSYTGFKRTFWGKKEEFPAFTIVKPAESANAASLSDSIQSLQDVLDSPELHVRMIIDEKGGITACRAEPLTPLNWSSTRSSTVFGRSLVAFNSPVPSSLASSTTAVSRSPLPITVSAQGRTTSRTIEIIDFEAIKSLGKGGEGVVLLVHDKVAQSHLAMKVVKMQALHPRAYPGVFDEQDMMKRLAGNPWFLTLQGSFYDTEHFFFLTKYYSRGSLHSEISRRRGLTLSEARRFAAELIYALGLLHQRRILHGDIKPQNLLVDDDDHLVIADFGLARDFARPKAALPWKAIKWGADDDASRIAEQDDARFRLLGLDMWDATRRMAGTPGFVAPEVWCGDRIHSYEADIWSAGVTIYNMITGQMPFGLDEDDSVEDYFDKTISVPLQFDAEKDAAVDADARDLLKQMLQVEPSRRATIADIKKHAYFDSIDWEQIARREVAHAGHVLPEQDIREREKLVFLPAALPFKEDEDPFPWFNWVSPALNVSGGRAQSEVCGKGSVDKTPTALQRVKEWWRSMTRKAVEVKPRVGPERMDLLA